MATTATPWAGDNDKKLYLQSGQFTSTLKDSEYVGAIDSIPSGIEWDGNNTPWIGVGEKKLYLQSGQFTSTLKTSQLVSSIDTAIYGISWDGNNTPWCGIQADKLYLQSGQFSSTLKTSEYVGGIDTNPSGPSWDGTNTPWIGWTDKKLYLQSGQFTSTIKTSEYVGGVDDGPTGISWDGFNTPWTGYAAKKLYLQSGQFSSTVKTSQDISSIEITPRGISTDDYLRRIGLEKTIEQTLTFAQQTDYEIIRESITRHVVDTLTFVQDAGYYSGILEPIDTLSFTQTIELKTNNLRVADVIVFEQLARRTETYEEIVTDTLTFIDSTTHFSNNISIIQSLYFNQDADVQGDVTETSRTVNDFLTFTDLAKAFIHFYAFHIADSISFQESIGVIHPYNIIATNTLTFDDALTIKQPYNESVNEYWDWEYNSNGYPIYPRESFVEEIGLEIVRTRRHNESLTLVQTVQVSKEIAAAVSKTVTNTLTFTDTASRVYGGIDVLIFIDSASVEQCHAGRDILSLSDSITYSIKTSYNLNDTLILESTVAYTLITPEVLCTYHPFIGESTVIGAPSPPRLTPSTIVKYDNVRLFYPSDNPTDIITLRGPELDDRDQLHFERISRETRGGTLIIFADPMWPQNQRLLLSFIGLNETDAQAALNFVEATVGQQIGLRDWEGKEWAGVILTPDNPITRNGIGNIGFDVEFEGVQVHRAVIEQSLVHLSQFVNTVIYTRPLGNTLTLSDQISGTIIYSRTITDTLTLSDQVASFHDTLWCGSAADKLYLQSGQFTSTVKTSQEIGTIDLNPLGISWDNTNTLWCGSEADKLYLQSGRFTSTVKTSQEIGTIDLNPLGISWDRTNTPWIGQAGHKLYLQSGQFTSTLKTSEAIGSIDSIGTGISWDGTNTPWCGYTDDKLYLQSGQFTSTVKTSQAIGNVDDVIIGISFDGINTPWIGNVADKLYLQSGQFSSTLKTSQSVTTVDDSPSGIDVTGLPFRLSA